MDWKGMFSISLPHFRSDCLTARMCVDGGQRTVLTCGDVWTGQSSELTFSTEILFEQAQRPQKIPFSLYEGNPMTIRVINALVRLVHGGRGMEDSKSSSFKTKSSKLTKSPMAEKKHQENSISNWMWSWWSSCSWWMEMDRWSYSGKDPQHTKKGNVRSKWLWRLSLWSSFDSRLERNSIEVPVECEGGQK